MLDLGSFICRVELFIAHGSWCPSHGDLVLKVGDLLYLSIRYMV